MNCVTPPIDSALDHQEEYFPIDSSSGHKVFTLDRSTKTEDVIYRYGIFGDCRFLNQLPKLKSKEEYNQVIKKLNQKMIEVESWIGEYESSDEIDQGHMNRIDQIEKFIHKLETIRDNIDE